MQFLVLAYLMTATVAEPIVHSSLGRITGFDHESDLGNVEVFLGIPYAKPPVGDLRFELPEPFGEVGNFSATEDKLPCLQQLGEMFSREDCLFLNVFRREGTKANDGKAVVVLIHSGFFSHGSAHDADLKPLVGIADVIAVSFNYRLGIFGFANFGNLSSPNVGFFDQRLALEWVKDNIKDFGGNPDRITVVGLEAGSKSIHAHLVTPLNRRRMLFNAALMEDGFLGHDLREATENSSQFLRRIALSLNCTERGREMLQCLKNVSASHLNIAQYSLKGTSDYSAFQPTIDGVFIPKHIDEIDDNEYANVKLIVGVAKDAGSFLVRRAMQHRDPPKTENEFLEICSSVGRPLSLPTNFSDPDVAKRIISAYYKQYSTLAESVTRFITDACSICPANDFVERYARNNRNVYMFFFERPFQSSLFDPGEDSVGTFHGTALMNFLGLLLEEGNLNSVDMRFSRDTVDLISKFVKTDHTPEFRGVRWPDFTLTKKVLRIEEIPTVAENLPRKQNCGGLF